MSMNFKGDPSLLIQPRSRKAHERIDGFAAQWSKTVC